jgi:hypothetical protein
MSFFITNTALAYIAVERVCNNKLDEFMSDIYCRKQTFEYELLDNEKLVITLEADETALFVAVTIAFKNKVQKTVVLYENGFSDVVLTEIKKGWIF